MNGKLPSQDLSSWIQLQTSKGLPELPPLHPVSPLSLDEVLKNPFDTRKYSPSTHFIPNNFPIVIRSKSDLVKTTEGIVVAEPVDSDPDPDILVLGFQELDLSTEALLYSTSTTREDAWSLSIFAALGEKAVRYEKVCSQPEALCCY